MIRPVISTTYHGRKVLSASAPTSGPITLNILNLIEPFKFSENGPTGLTYHRLIEALKFGYAARSELGDPSFLNNHDRLAEIITKEWADHIRQNITDVSTFLNFNIKSVIYFESFYLYVIGYYTSVVLL